MLNRILVPLDGSPAMTEIIPAVRQLVRGTGAVVHLLAVRPPVHERVRRERRPIYVDDLLLEGLTGWAPQLPRPESYLEETLEDRLRAERTVWHEYLARQGSQLAYDGVVVQREVSFGDPLTETLAAAERQAVRLITLATRPQLWLKRLLRPNLAQQLLAQSAVPVLAVPPGGLPPGRSLR